MTEVSIADPHPFSELRRTVPMRIGPRAGLVMQGRSVPNSNLVAMYGHDGLINYFINLNGKDILPFREGPEEPIYSALHRYIDNATGRGTRGVCYFIGGDSGPIKIGFSVDLKSRLTALRASSPLWLEVLAVRPGGESRERIYHEQFAADRLHGEWFARSPAILAEIAHLNQNGPQQCWKHCAALAHEGAFA